MDQRMRYKIRKLARVNSGSLYYFFHSKEDLLAAVLEKHKSMLGPQVPVPIYEDVSDPIERIFAILNGYRRQLRDSDFRRGYAIGTLALEISNRHPKVRPLIAENFQAWCGTIEGLIKEASDRLPAKTRPGSLARVVLATMEGCVMLARAYRSLEPFDQVVNHLKDYFDRLLKDRAESESKQASSDGNAKEKSK